MSPSSVGEYAHTCMWEFGCVQLPWEIANIVRNSVADPDPGSGAFLTPGSGIPDLGSRISDPGSRIPDLGSWISDPGFRIPDPGSRIPDLGSRISDPGPRILDLGSRISDPGSRAHIFESLVTIFWVKSSIILWKLTQNLSSAFQK